MTSDEVRRITERRNEAAAAMDACELEEAHRDEESSACSTFENIAKMLENNDFQNNLRSMGWCVRRY